MSIKFTENGITDSLLNAVKNVTGSVSKYAAFGRIEEKKKMDPVGQADSDIDNDGDVDKSDKYLHNRRKAIKKAMGGKKDEVEMNPKSDEDKGVKEGKDSGLENPHNCATHVYSEQWGDGQPVKTMHADPDENGNIAWYDVMFEHGIEKRVPIEELKVIKSSHHGHKKRGK